MKNEKLIYLNDAFWFQEGPGLRNTHFKDNGIKILNVANILKSGYIDLNKTKRYLGKEEVKTKYKHFLCDEGDLVIPSSGIIFDVDGLLRTRGAFIKLQHLPLCMNTSVIRFKSLNGNCLNYLRHWLQSYEFRNQITKLVTGSAQQNFGPSHLKKIKIKLPSPTKQLHIANILDKVENIIFLREQAIAKLEKLSQSTFELLINNSKESNIKLSELTTNVSTVNPIKIYNKKKFTYIDIASINNKSKSITKKKLITGINAPSRARQAVKINDILVSTVRPNLNAVAKISTEYQNPIASTGFCVLRCDESKLLPEVLFSVVKSKKFIDEMTNMTNGASYPAVTDKIVKTYKVSLITKNEQIKFSKFIKNNEIQKTKLISHSIKLNLLFDSLQHQSFEMS